MSRIKPSKEIKIKNLDECNHMLYSLACARQKQKEEEVNYERAINTYKELAARRIKPMAEKIKIYEDWLAEYAEAHPEHFEKKKTVELTFGMFGFRKSTKIRITQKTLGLLKSLKFLDAVRIRESVDKDVLRGFTDVQLGTVKAKRLESNDFWYELNDDKIAEKIARAAS